MKKWRMIMGAIRIEGDCKDEYSFKVTDLYTGEKINGIVSIRVEYDVYDGVKAFVTLIPDEIDMRLPATFQLSGYAEHSIASF
jgi:hypothetical protein